MVFTRRADSYQRMVKFFKIWVKVWLRLLATCSSSGWALFLEKTLHVVHYLLLGFLVFGTVIGVSRAPSYRLKAEICLHPIGAVLVIITLFRLRLKQRRLIGFFENILRCSGVIFGNSCFLRTMQSFKRTCSIMLPIIFLQHANVIIIPFWRTALNQDFEHHVDVTTVPHFLTCRNVNVSRDSSNLCWDVENNFQSLVKNVSVTFFFVCMILPFSTSLTFIAFVIIFVKTNVLVICEELNVIAEYIRRSTQSQSGGPASTRGASLLVHERLRKVVVYYLEVYRNMNHVTPILISIAEYFLTVFYLLSIFILAPILKEYHLITNPIYAMKSVSTIMILFIAFSVFCYGGQVIQEMNLKIAEAVYNLPWYDDTILNQQLIYNFLLILRRPCQIFVFYGTKMELRLSLITLYQRWLRMRASSPNLNQTCDGVSDSSREKPFVEHPEFLRFLRWTREIEGAEVE